MEPGRNVTTRLDTLSWHAVTSAANIANRFATSTVESSVHRAAGDADKASAGTEVDAAQAAGLPSLRTGPAEAHARSGNGCDERKRQT
jgi:hypothetical protein